MKKTILILFAMLSIVLISGCSTISPVSVIALDVDYLNNTNQTLYYNGSIDITGSYLINGSPINITGGGISSLDNVTLNNVTINNAIINNVTYNNITYINYNATNSITLNGTTIYDWSEINGSGGGGTSNVTIDTATLSRIDFTYDGDDIDSILSQYDLTNINYSFVKNSSGSLVNVSVDYTNNSFGTDYLIEFNYTNGRLENIIYT